MMARASAGTWSTEAVIVRIPSLLILSLCVDRWINCPQCILYFKPSGIDIRLSFRVRGYSYEFDVLIPASSEGWHNLQESLAGQLIILSSQGFLYSLEFIITFSF